MRKAADTEISSALTALQKKRTKPSALTPKSKKYMEDLGYLVARTEHWNSFAKIRQDLFGFIDLVALCVGGTTGVQVTSRANMSSRVKKIKESEFYEKIKRAGWDIEVHGWDKKDGKWRMQREVL